VWFLREQKHTSDGLWPRKPQADIDVKTTLSTLGELCRNRGRCWTSTGADSNRGDEGVRTARHQQQREDARILFAVKYNI
jgi:hypothetical protein